MWDPPACDSVSGTAAVTFSKDSGTTFAPISGQLPNVSYTAGLVALNTAGHLVAENSGDVLRSTDAGCTWTKIGDAPTTITRLVAAGTSRAYGYSPNAGSFYRVDADVVTVLTSPVAQIMAAGVDRSNPDRVRIGDKDGKIWESKDGGQTFNSLSAGLPDGCFYTMAFDPNDLDHALCGTLGSGVSVTFNGGAQWDTTNIPGPTNGFSMAVSPVLGKRVWLRAVYSVDDTKGVLVSDDGGLTWSPALVDGQQGFATTNGPVLIPDIANADVVYIPHPTDLYRFDLSQNKVELLDPHFYQAEAVTIAPASPPILYVGLTQEIIN